MKRYFLNLYYRATRREYNRGVDAGRWVITKRLYDIIAISGTREEMVYELAGLIHREEMYRANHDLEVPTTIYKQLYGAKRNGANN